MNLRQLKVQATKREYQRVFDYMCLPARDIIVEYEGQRWIKSSWNGINRFGWGKWEKVA
jgi:hypothetical protein